MWEYEILSKKRSLEFGGGKKSCPSLSPICSLIVCDLSSGKGVNSSSVYPISSKSARSSSDARKRTSGSRSRGFWPVSLYRVG